MARNIKHVENQTNSLREMQRRDELINDQGDMIIRFCQTYRLVFAECQKKDPDLVAIRRWLGDSYPGGLQALMKGANGRTGRQNGS